MAAVATSPCTTLTWASFDAVITATNATLLWSYSRISRQHRFLCLATWPPGHSLKLFSFLRLLLLLLQRHLSPFTFLLLLLHHLLISLSAYSTSVFLRYFLSTDPLVLSFGFSGIDAKAAHKVDCASTGSSSSRSSSPDRLNRPSTCVRRQMT